MKRRACMTVLATVLCAALLASPSSMYATAAGVYDFNAAYQNDDFTVETASFRYTTSYNGMVLEADAAQDAQFMVAGVFHGKNGDAYYIITPINESISEEGRGYYTPQDGSTYVAGDLLRFSELVSTAIIPTTYAVSPYATNPENAVEYLGNALDIFGDDFMPVLRHELLIETDTDSAVPRIQQKPQNITLTPGDITEDGKLNIMDVITLNKTLLGGRTSNSYQRLVSDADGDGEVTQADALLMMKYIVGLVEELG